MIHTASIDDLSKTLKAVLQDPAFAMVFPELQAADIVFDRPSDTFAPAKTTVDLFLYDLRENLELRLNETTTERVDGKVITHPAPLRLACSYLATAWPVGGADLALQEHRLLSAVLVVLAHYPTIPSSFLQGSLAGPPPQDPSLPMVALHPDALKNLAEFWSSLGTKLRASLTVTVTISVPVFFDISDFIVTTHSTSYAPGASTPPETLLQFGGQVVDANSQGIAGALVDLLDAGLLPVKPRQIAAGDGRFDFDRVAKGSYQIRAVAAGFKIKTQPIQIPGRPEDYVIQLAPL